MIRLPLLAIATLFLTLTEGLYAYAVELPDIGESAGAYISPEQEHKIGEAFYRNLRSEGKIIEDPELQAYIQSIGEKLASHAEAQPSPFTYFLVDDPEINAFAVPGGFVGVNTGLVLLTESESELASVLAHETSHVTQHHMARMFEAASRMSIPSAIAMLGAIALGVMSPQAGQAAIAAVAAGQQQYALNFTRANEEEADRIGMDLLERSGFNPEAMPSFFERLQTANRYNDPANVPEFLRDHPVTTNRIADARARADQYPHHPYKNSAAFYLMRAKIRVLTATNPQQAVTYFQDTLREGLYRSADSAADPAKNTKESAAGPSAGNLAANSVAYLAYSAADAGEEAARYGYAMALMQVSEYGKARVQLQRLLQARPENPTFLLAAAKIDVAEKAYPQGLATYDKLLRLYPGYRPAVIGSVEALLANKQAEKARVVLRDYVSQHNNDPAGYKLLAEAEGRMGRQVESHMAQAEFYYNNGDLHLAIEQLKLAQKIPQMTYYQRERVRARLDELQKEFDEQKKEKKEG